MLGILGSFITSGVLGGLTGVLGNWLQQRANAKMKKLEIEADVVRMAHELKIKEADLAIMGKEWAGRQGVAIAEASGAEAVAELKAFTNSYNIGPQYSKGIEPSTGQAWALVALDLFRGSIRPGLTVFLIAMTAKIYFQAQTLMVAPLITQELASDIVIKVISTILYLTTSSFMWWFGSRNNQKPPTVLGG